jgi:hypothetical protein
MGSDNLKLIFTYSIALILIVGGLVMLYAIRLDPKDSASTSYGLLIAGFIGSAVTFVFQREAATQATRAAQSSNAAGVASATGTTPPPPNPPTQ